MAMFRELDTRKEGHRLRGKPVAAAAPVVAPAMASRVNTLTGAPGTVVAAVPTGSEKTLSDKALAFIQKEHAQFGFAPEHIAEFVPDPVVQRTSSGSAAVHLHQRYRGLPVFQMTRTIRFNHLGQVVDAVGDSASLPDGLDIAPRLAVTEAVLKAAQHLAETGAGETYTNQFHETLPIATLVIKHLRP